MSVSSTASSITVSAFGEDMPLEQAIDQVYKDLQGALNFSHASTRELSMEAEREGDFKDVMNHAFEIQDYIDDMLALFKELKVVVKQVVGKPKTEDEKAWLKSRKDEIKRKKEQEKAIERADREKAKAEKQAQRDRGDALNQFMSQAQI